MQGTASCNNQYTQIPVLRSSLVLVSCKISGPPTHPDSHDTRIGKTSREPAGIPDTGDRVVKAKY